MKKLLLLLIMAGALIAGCVYPHHYSAEIDTGYYPYGGPNVGLGFYYPYYSYYPYGYYYPRTYYRSYYRPTWDYRYDYSPNRYGYGPYRRR